MTNPHDALFQYTFSQLEHAARLIRDDLPASMKDEGPKLFSTQEMSGAKEP